MTGGQLALALLVLLSYPLQLHPCRTSLLKVVSPNLQSSRKWLAITLGIMLLSYLVAITVTNLSTVLSIVGATGSTTICYILPGLFFTKLGQGAVMTSARRLGFFMIGFGGLVMVSSLAALFLGSVAAH